jgi:hypothetical protein
MIYRTAVASGLSIIRDPHSTRAGKIHLPVPTFRKRRTRGFLSMMTKQNTKYEPHPECMVEGKKLRIGLYKKFMTHISRICMAPSHHDVSTRFGDDDDDDDDKPYQTRLNRAEKTKRRNSVRKDTVRFSIYIRNTSSLVLAVAFQVVSSNAIQQTPQKAVNVHPLRPQVTGSLFLRCVIPKCEGCYVHLCFLLLLLLVLLEKKME